MCIHNGCTIQPVFNICGETSALYCVSHKMEGMIDVKNKNKLCVYIGCKKRSQFNVDTEKKALYCLLHKKEGMIDVNHKKCIYNNCKTRPTFNIEYEKKALYCSIHKKDGMVNVRNNKCIYEGCKIISNFNIEGKKQALYCSIHKKDGMVNVRNKKCIYENCKTRPNYNIEGNKTAIYCVTHKKEGMVDVQNKKCIYEGCNKQSTFNIKDCKNALYCTTHKKEGMIDVKSKKCKSEWCLTQVKDKYNGYCLYCYINLFPDKRLSCNYKTKEYAVVEHIKTNIPNNWVVDKIIQGGYSKRRPDLLLDLGEQVIIIEIDENQHIDYDCSCENKRLMELSQDLQHRPIVFIRFNPDSYKKNGKNITSCWSINGNGICIVSKSKKDEWIERLNVLVEQTNYWINNKTNKTIEIIQMFYDM
jgi:hypothetical protein